jgi:hypothetical protein
MRYIAIAVVALLAFSAGASAQTKHAPLSEQGKCAAQAKKFYNESDFPSTKHATKNEFTSHYDAVNLICYVRINVTTVENGTATVGSYIFDAFENRTFASYTWLSVKGKKYWEVKPMECNVKPINGKKIVCESTQEFEDMVDKYFALGE